MTDGRTRTFGALALSGFFIISTAAPSSAAPSWEEANDRADTLGAAAQRITDQQDATVASLARHERRLRSVENRLDDARADRRESRRVLTSTLLDGLNSGTSGLADVVAPDGVTEVDLVSENEVGSARDLRRAERAIDALRERQDELQVQIRKLDKVRDARRPKVEQAQEDAAVAQALVDRLEEERASRAAEREEAQAAAASSAGAAAAVDYALAQVGDSYVYGAVGPDAYDCSGLTMAAWAQGGVSLPHSSSAQMGSGTPVSTDALQPGDLVFYYSPVSHVGIYIGDGQIVHAANPSTDVQVAPLHMMPLTGAVRPG